MIASQSREGWFHCQYLSAQEPPQPRFAGFPLLTQGNNILDESEGLIAPPGQEEWREAPGWLFNHKIESVVQPGH